LYTSISWFYSIDDNLIFADKKRQYQYVFLTFLFITFLYLKACIYLLFVYLFSRRISILQNNILKRSKM